MVWTDCGFLRKLPPCILAHQDAREDVTDDLRPAEPRKDDRDESRNEHQYRQILKEEAFEH